MGSRDHVWAWDPHECVSSTRPLGAKSRFSILMGAGGTKRLIALELVRSQIARLTPSNGIKSRCPPGAKRIWPLVPASGLGGPSGCPVDALKSCTVLFWQATATQSAAPE